MPSQEASIATGVAVAAGIVYLLRRRRAAAADGNVKGYDPKSLLSAVNWFGNSRADVNKTADEYLSLQEGTWGSGGSEDKRREEYGKMVTQYYDLVTDFYEYGWGHCFHFAPRYGKETFKESIMRHEHYLFSKLKMSTAAEAAKAKFVDFGCGVGGPGRVAARYLGSQVGGVNISNYQLQRAKMHTANEGLTDRCSYVESDFMKTPLESGTFDGAFAVEATCHAPDKVGCFKEVLRILKPGARFAGYEWCMTYIYDENDAEHVRIKRQIEETDALPGIASCQDVIDALEAAGFDTLEAFDRAPTTPAEPVTWYEVIAASGWSFEDFRASRTGIVFTHCFCWLLETLWLAPKGTTKTHAFLAGGLPDLVKGGSTGTFTPMLYFCAEKPLPGAKRKPHFVVKEARDVAGGKPWAAAPAA